MKFEKKRVILYLYGKSIYILFITKKKYYFDKKDFTNLEDLGKDLSSIVKELKKSCVTLILDNRFYNIFPINRPELTGNKRKDRAILEDIIKEKELDKIKMVDEFIFYVLDQPQGSKSNNKSFLIASKINEILSIDNALVYTGVQIEAIKLDIQVLGRSLSFLYSDLNYCYLDWKDSVANLYFYLDGDFFNFSVLPSLQNIEDTEAEETLLASFLMSYEQLLGSTLDEFSNCNIYVNPAMKAGPCIMKYLTSKTNNTFILLNLKEYSIDNKEIDLSIAAQLIGEGFHE